MRLSRLSCVSPNHHVSHPTITHLLTITRHPTIMCQVTTMCPITYTHNPMPPLDSSSGSAWVLAGILRFAAYKHTLKIPFAILLASLLLVLLEMSLSGCVN
ncbi:hypothetical protein M405DRAFT_593231 [Rhizopogon salebrosus TDB-379]|nr:hypothetical protein M405DRAFT_593231 [Rhizopogon salebrosus TDB-379]